MMVYHGSDEKFDRFDYSKIGKNGTSEGKGFYFTDNKNIAKGYGENGYLYLVEFKGNKSLSIEEKTISIPQLKEFLIELNKLTDYLSNWGDIEYSGLDNVLNEAIKGEYYYADNDVDLITGICTASGDMEVSLNLLHRLYGYDSIIIEEAEWGENQKIYIALIRDIIEIKDVIKL